MKKIFGHLIVILGAAGLGLAVGWALRQKTVSPTRAEVAQAPSESSVRKMVQTSKANVGIRPGDDSELATRLERNLSMSSGVTRWLYWLEALEQASASDYPRLFRLAEQNTGARSLVSRRWIELYPRQLFEVIVDSAKKGIASSKTFNGLSHQLFQEWCKQNPHDVVAALNSAEDFPTRHGWRQTVAGHIIENDAELGIRLFSEWHIDNYTPSMKGIAKWAASDPRHAAEVALSSSAGYASKTIVETVGKEWAKIDPARALEFAAAKSGDLGSILASAALKEWAGRNLDEAAAWLAASDVRTRNRLGSAFVEAWANHDPNSALTWCESNLSGSSLVQAVGGVLKGAAAKDVAAAAQLVTALIPSAARSEGAAAVARKWFPQSFDMKPVPPEAVAWVAGLDHDSKQRVLDEVKWAWTSSDPESMAAFLASSNELFTRHIYETVARDMVRKDPVRALEWANELSQGGSIAGAKAFSEWRRTQPEPAMKWLNELPDNDARRDVYFRSAVRALVWDVQGTQRLADLSASERTIARDVVREMSLPDEKRNSLLEVLK